MRSAPPPRKLLRPLFLLLVAGLAALSFWLAGFWLEFRSREPRGRFATVEEFQGVMNRDGAHRWMKFHGKGRTWYEARRSMPLWAAPSGSTCYVFDDAGRFQDWVEDNGESTTWDVNWGQIGRVETTYEHVARDLSR